MVATRFCWICGRSIALEQCKVDEHGLPVHELCQVTRLKLYAETGRRSPAEHVCTDSQQI